VRQKRSQSRRTCRGLARLIARGSDESPLALIDETLTRVQNDLFDLSADLCLPKPEDEKPGAAPPIAPSRLSRRCFVTG
jgi:cob(I)alamin adenosyltransferase